MTRAEYKRRYREANRERIASQKKAYYEANRSHLKEKSREYRDANKELKLTRDKKYRDANRERVAAAKRAYAAGLSDGYVAWRLRMCGLPITPETIEIKRTQITLKRTIKELKNV